MIIGALPSSTRCAIISTMKYDDRKTYAVAREPDGTYAIIVRQDDFLIGLVPGFPTLDVALDERARMDADEHERPSAIRHSDEQRTQGR